MPVIDPSRFIFDKTKNGTLTNSKIGDFSKLMSKDYLSEEFTKSDTSYVMDIYFTTDTPIYATGIELLSLSEGDINRGVKYILFQGFGENFKNVLFGSAVYCDTTTGLGTYMVPTDKIQKTKYFRIRIAEPMTGTQPFRYKIDWLKIYGENAIPKYLLKDSTNGYYYTKDNTVFMQKEDITEDKLMGDINEMTKDNLELINGAYKVLRIMVP